MHSLVTFLLLGVSLVQGVSYQVLVDEQWQNFKLEHGKFYQSDEEEQYRQRIFMQNFHQVTHHNKLYEMGLKSYKMRINHFGDLTGDEFLKLYTVQMPELSDFPQDLNSSDVETYVANLMDLPKHRDDFINYEPPSEIDVDDLPQDIDWTTKGMVTPVKNQGQCGSCWSFSATGALEAQWFKKTGRLISLSEQNLVDCSWKFGNHGCNGGWMHWAFNYIRYNGGIDTEQSYPYQARSGFCHYSPANKGATVRGVVQFRGEAQLQAKVSTVGPIAVAIEVSHNFQHYYSGVYDEPRCGHRLNHAVLVVGYGNEGGRAYWLVKNSWGSTWGSRGYIKMSRNKNNQCGIADAPSYPIV